MEMQHFIHFSDALDMLLALPELKRNAVITESVCASGAISSIASSCNFISRLTNFGVFLNAAGGK